MTRSPSQCPGTARSATSAGRVEMWRSRHPRLAPRSASAGAGLRVRAWPDRNAARPAGPARRAARPGLDVDRLVDRLVRHPHLRPVGELLAQPPRSAAATTAAPVCPSPSATTGPSPPAGPDRRTRPASPVGRGEPAAGPARAPAGARTPTDTHRHDLPCSRWTDPGGGHHHRPDTCPDTSCSGSPPATPSCGPDRSPPRSQERSAPDRTTPRSERAQPTTNENQP